MEVICQTMPAGNAVQHGVLGKEGKGTSNACASIKLPADAFLDRQGQAQPRPRATLI